MSARALIAVTAVAVAGLFGYYRSAQNFAEALKREAERVLQIQTEMTALRAANAAADKTLAEYMAAADRAQIANRELLIRLNTLPSADCPAGEALTAVVEELGNWAAVRRSEIDE